MKIFLLAFSLCFSLAMHAQVLVSAELIGSKTQEELVLAPGLPAPPYAVDYYKLVYNTTDAVGDATIASGLLAVPVSPDCVGFPLAVYMHGTTLAKENVPSRDNAEAGVVQYLAALGYFSCAPDYVGMGDSPGLHPYVHAASEASAGVDMMRASREYLDELGRTDNGQVFISGYSQGGHAGMAVHKYIEDNDLLDEFDILISGLGSGPYNLSGTQTEVILSDEPYSNPGYLVYALASYDLAYDNLYDTYSDVLQSPYDDIVVPYFNGNNTNQSMNGLNAQLPNTVSELIQPDYLAAIEADMMHPVRTNLMDNDNYDWAPTRTINMYYCTLDEQVPFSNSLDADSAMTASGSTVVTAIFTGETDHGGCYFGSMFGAFMTFEEVKEGCVIPTTVVENGFEVQIGPNPVVGELRITSKERLTKVEVFGAGGVLVHAQDYVLGQTSLILSTDGVPAGRYHMRLTAANGKTVERSIIKE